LASREPPPPPELLEWLPAVRGQGSLIEALAAAGRETLSRALERPGRDREAAFLLLTADALTTYACEAAAGAADPVGELRIVLARLEAPT
jgi:hypothetical protein